jgi:diguanylate cyclase (GGDEF)-like protein
MISLRKHIETDPSLNAYRAALDSMAESGQRAVPGLGDDLHSQLTAISQSLGVSATSETLSKTTISLKSRLHEWAESASKHHVENEREIREIIAVITRAGEAVAARDEKYAAELTSLNTRLQSLAELDDLAVIRKSILESTRALKSCVEQMAEDGRESIHKLTGEIAEYKTRLEASEKLSTTDPLTGLGNRRGFENELEARVATRQKFSLIMMDLNSFKSINDKHGHLAGDDLLRQFSAELKAQSRAGDYASRWGGDEFVVIIVGTQPEAEASAERIRRWVMGEYKIKSDRGAVKIDAQASLGLVQWDGIETSAELIARADRKSYAAKPVTR